MTNLLQTGSQWLGDQLLAHAATEVQYVRGLEQALVRATIGKTEFEIEDAAGAIERVQSRDYLIEATELVLGGSRILPQVGDRIYESQGDQTFAYEVLSPGTQPCWRFSDPHRQLLRIHTKHIA